MTCSRCGGMVILEKIPVTVIETKYGAFLEIFKCIQCGFVFDETILKNREMQKQGGYIGKGDNKSKTRHRVSKSRDGDIISKTKGCQWF